VGLRVIILVSQFLRFPQPGGPGSRIYIPQEQGDPDVPPGSILVQCLYTKSVLHSTPNHMGMVGAVTWLASPCSRTDCMGTRSLLIRSHGACESSLRCFQVLICFTIFVAGTVSGIEGNLDLCEALRVQQVSLFSLAKLPYSLPWCSSSLYECMLLQHGLYVQIYLWLFIPLALDTDYVSVENIQQNLLKGWCCEIED
jgi:hypothetical protein